MRVIKFRTWDGELKEYSEWTNRDPFFSTSEGRIFFWERTKDENGQYGGDIILEDFGERFILDQYTGLKDKNGKEIFEGDIVRYDLGNPEVTWNELVAWEAHGWRTIHFDGTESGSNPLHFIPSMEIIGNIHENPNLLDK